MARTLKGTVTSDKMNQTVVVSVARVKSHPIYRKKYQETAKFVAHNPENQYKLGDMVEITETRPMSRTKRWIVQRKLELKELEG